MENMCSNCGFYKTPPLFWGGSTEPSLCDCPKERSYSEEEVNKMFDTLKINSVDNVATIHNVDLFISSWKQEFKNK